LRDYRDNRCNLADQHSLSTICAGWN